MINSMCAQINLEKNLIISHGTLKDIDADIDRLIKNAGLTKETNNFFKTAKKIKRINAYPAMVIAANWREITKTFLFTTLVGIGRFSEQFIREENPDQDLLKALQTGVAVIADDLNNTFHIFDKIAPKGAEGIHYIWWEKSILNPLKNACHASEKDIAFILSPETKRLTNGMLKLSESPLGFAVQLRIVEAIALDIVLAFRTLFQAVEIDDKKLFSSRENLSWIYSHITAEVVHHRQVKDEDVGMAVVAQTPAQQFSLLQLAKFYLDLWGRTFDRFTAIIQSQS